MDADTDTNTDSDTDTITDTDADSNAGTNSDTNIIFHIRESSNLYFAKFLYRAKIRQIGHFKIPFKWCLHCGVNRSKLGPFLNVENIFLCFKRHCLRAIIAVV